MTLFQKKKSSYQKKVANKQAGFKERVEDFLKKEKVFFQADSEYEKYTLEGIIDFISSIYTLDHINSTCYEDGICEKGLKKESFTIEFDDKENPELVFSDPALFLKNGYKRITSEMFYTNIFGYDLSVEKVDK